MAVVHIADGVAPSHQSCQRARSLRAAKEGRATENTMPDNSQNSGRVIVAKKSSCNTQRQQIASLETNFKHHDAGNTHFCFCHRLQHGVGCEPKAHFVPAQHRHPSLCPQAHSQCFLCYQICCEFLARSI